MSILIKGMKKSKCCLECVFGYIKTEIYCMALHEYIEVDDNYKYKKCPLVEVPEPHGRLIDSELAEHVVGMGTQVTLSKKERILAIQGLPTVIEAEGAGE